MCMSTKSKVVASAPGVANIISRALQARGATTTPEHIADDLGISTAAGGRRAVKRLNQRIMEGRRKATRVRMLMTAAPKAKSMYRAWGGVQAGVWRRSVRGLPCADEEFEEDGGGIAPTTRFAGVPHFGVGLGRGREGRPCG